MKFKNIKSFREYKKPIIKEFVEYDDIDNELLEMANFTKKTTGIDGCYLVGTWQSNKSFK